MKTLYVSDLDGTLLRSDQRVSPYTCRVINRLVGEGMIFSYATARSYHTASKVAGGIDARIPLIVYNGAFILDNRTRDILLSSYFDPEDAREILDRLLTQGIEPLVYSFQAGVERFSYRPERIGPGAAAFVGSRRGDARDHPVADARELGDGDVFYFTCIDRADKLLPVYQALRDRFYCVYQRDIYSGDQWLEVMPPQVSKANAILQLKRLMGCDRVVSFGDGRNDLPMFRISDQCYAVENAVDELKAQATAVIGGNDADGVARWLEENVRL